jgi:thiol:disulfide interchange protein/DsbC/DsbD-like thiol-disulfide interchange protein
LPTSRGASSAVGAIARSVGGAAGVLLRKGSERMRENHRLCRSLCGTIIGVLWTAASAWADVAIAVEQARPVDARHVAASLSSETRNIVPGRALEVALRQQIEPGWHTYWSNPGDSGLPTTIEWLLPRGFTAGPISWPTPERFTVGPVVGYGYEKEVLLPVTIDVPADLQQGSDVTISAHVSWLACSDICIPEEAELRLSVPVGTVPEPDPYSAQAFAAARARIPRSNPFLTTATSTNEEITLRVATGDARNLQDVSFLPADADVIDDGAPQSVVGDSDGLVLRLKRDITNPPPVALNGFLVFRDRAAQAGGSSGALSISVPIDPVAPGFHGGVGLLAALLLALAGGIILNLMPCVLPVLSIKVLALVQHSQSTPRETRLHGIVYAVGVLVSFAMIAGALIGLRAAGAEIGWGFQLQSPIFVTLMIYLLFAVGLNLSGVFSVGNGIVGVGNGLASRQGYVGSFFTGTLTTLVATPCTAPFMAAAVGYAVTQPWYVALGVLEAIGLGLALPYLVVAFSPRARRLLPRPGIWMLRLKEILAFPVYGTAVWLMYVLFQQTGASGATASLAGLVLIAFAAWLYNAVYSSEGRSRNWGVGLAASAAAGAFALLTFVDDGGPSRPSTSTATESLDWQPFSQAKLDGLRAEGRPVFIDFTAAWCITCKVNERLALADPSVRQAFADGGVAALRADWTRQDAGITRILAANGRAGVPLYLFYPKPAGTGEPKQPITLPQLLTAASILHEIRRD